jgi:predicted DNA-binding protein
MKSYKPDSPLRVRVPLDVRLRILRLAKKDGRKESEVVRRALEWHADNEEKRLRLRPITSREQVELESALEERKKKEKPVKLRDGKS